jgi:hypothetical protein
VSFRFRSCPLYLRADVRSAEEWPFIKNESFLGSYICPCGSACLRRIATALYRVRKAESLRSVSGPASICLSMPAQRRRSSASTRRRSSWKWQTRRPEKLQFRCGSLKARRIPDAIEARRAVVAANDRLAVYDAGPRPQAGERLDNQREPIGQIIAWAAVEPNAAAVLVGDDPEAVVLISCSQNPLQGGVEALVGRHGAMKPDGSVRMDTFAHSDSTRPAQASRMGA